MSPEQYERASYVPHWAAALGGATPATVWTEGDDVDEAWEAAQRLGPPPWIVKDHLKSAKEAWDEACFVPAGADRVRFGEMNFWATILGAAFCLPCGKLLAALNCT